jgi:RimJ/RimL family protein N-acetyltransferase
MPLTYPTPELASARVILRKWSMNDLACVESASRAGYSRGSTIPRDYTDEEGRAWIERQWSRQQHGLGLSLAVAHRDSGTAVGMVYMGLQGIQGHGALGYWLVPEIHRQGFGTEAVSLVCNWALRETHLYRLVAYVEPANTASIALLRKCGFTEEGRLRSFLTFDDGVFDALSFSLLTSDLTHRS